MRRAIDRARRAQIDAGGGYTIHEREARQQEKELGLPAVDRIARLEADREALQVKLHTAEKRDRRMAAEIHDLRAEMRRVRNALYQARKARDTWYTRATGKAADEGRGAAKTSLRRAA